MNSIKVTKKTKDKIDQTQAEILLKHQKKVGQAELLEKIVDKTLNDPVFVEKLFEDESEEIIKPKHQKRVEVHITKKTKGKIRLFQEEWED
jgi:hypothetical protein